MNETSVIISNQIECLLCGDMPFSAHVHDYKQCKCGKVAVDGGMSYLRRTGESCNYRDMSIIINKDVFEKCMDSLSWCDETKRNNLGRVCAFFRALRDTGFLSK